MKSKASAPGKIILFGEHFVVYGVKAILCAINKRITVTAWEIPENKVSIKSSIGESEFSTGKPITEISSNFKPFYYLANEMLKKHKKKSGVRIVVESEIPAGVGLGSSSACCVAGAAAISRLFESHSREEILKMAIDAERTIFQNTSGADCTVCTLGGLIEYDKKNGFTQMEYKPTFHLIVINSNMKHSTEKVVSEVKKFKEDNESLFSDICSRESELIYNAMNLLKNNDIKELGKRMQENQIFLETIGVSNQKLREIIKITEGKSFGSKITGAGGGGCVIALTDKANIENIMKALKKSNQDCFSVTIDFKGLDTF